jgi:hypothetical protein
VYSDIQISNALCLYTRVKMNIIIPIFALSCELYGADSVGLPDGLLEIDDGNNEGGVHARHLVAYAIEEPIDVDSRVSARDGPKILVVINLGELYDPVMNMWVDGTEDNANLPTTDNR